MWGGAAPGSNNATRYASQANASTPCHIEVAFGDVRYMRLLPLPRRTATLLMGVGLVSACRVQTMESVADPPRQDPAPAVAPASVARPATVTAGRPRVPSPAASPPTEETPAPFRDADIPWERTPVLQVLADIAHEATDTRYLHTTIVDPARGIYYFDCSGMAAWVLRRAAPYAQAQVASGLGSRRPVSSTFTHAIRRAPSDATRGWQRVLRMADAAPGDVIAWIKPPIVRSGNTGHIGFIVLPPRELADEGFVATYRPDGERDWIELGGDARAYLVRIADATHLHHLDDSRAEGNRNGFGFGTILVVSDATGHPVAYGWVGPRGNVFSTDIGIGRPLT